MSDLRQWLTSLGLDCYAEVFAKNNIDSKTLADLTEQDLAALGVSQALKRLGRQDVTAMIDSMNVEASLPPTVIEQARLIAGRHPCACGP